MKIAAKTDMGLSRELNEDSFNIIENYEGVPSTFIIADGMGGHNSGEVASKMAVDIISSQMVKLWEKELKEKYLNDGDIKEEDVLKLLSRLLKDANFEVYRISMEQGKNFGMGTTVIAAIELNKKLFIAHIGDSRVYAIRYGEMRQITIDHSYVEELVKTGSLTREEAENHPRKNIITRALGCEEEIDIDTYLYEIKDDDIIIMCTDGLTNMLSDDEITKIVLKSNNPEIACKELVNRANSGGGKDNITVILIEF